MSVYVQCLTCGANAPMVAAAVPLSDDGNHIPATKDGVPHSRRLLNDAIV